MTITRNNLRGVSREGYARNGLVTIDLSDLNQGQ